MRVPLSVPILLAIASVFVIAATSGCGGADNSGRCSSCVNGGPFGPNVSSLACAAFAVQFECENARLENPNACGQNSAADAAACVVWDCEREVVCPQLGTP